MPVAVLLTLALLSLLCALLPAGLWCANRRLYLPPPLPSTGVELPAISVLIPARNEELNIADALQSVLASQGVEFEIIVLNDGSTDATHEIVSGYAQRDPRLRLEKAPPLPTGWNGKMHACHHLSTLARHSSLLFVDADVRLLPEALARLSPLLAQADLWSGVPRQITGTFSEKLLIPLIHFVLLGYLPMGRMRHSLDPALGAGCGQLIFTRADAYQRAGGHAGIRTSMHDGLHLPRLFRQAGLRTDLADLTSLATCRLYDSDAATWRGLAKNAHQGMGAWGVIFPMTILLGLGQIAPIVLLVKCLFLPHSRPVFMVSAMAYLVALLVHGDRVVRFQQSAVSFFLYPVAVACLLGIQWWARLRMALRLGASWKGRTYHAE